MQMNQIGGYEIIDLVGEGGQGAVYRAQDPSSGQTVAIKILSHSSSDGEFLDRFQREASIMATIRHPNVVEVYDHGEEDGGSEGLGLIGGTVRKIKISPEHADVTKLPHIGWNQVTFFPNGIPIAEKFINRLDQNPHFYFVHSYIFHPKNTENYTRGETYYAGQKFMSAVIKENIIGTQFHPEKSGNDGLLMIKNFLTL